jgi:hypothetical protein
MTNDPAKRVSLIARAPRGQWACAAHECQMWRFDPWHAKFDAAGVTEATLAVTPAG